MKKTISHLRVFRHGAGIILLLGSLGISFGDGGLNHQTYQARPISLGTSGGNIADRSTLYCCSGTLGALVQDSVGVKYILSNNHVLARGNQATLGDDVNQPGQIDQNCAQDGVVADLSAFVSLKFGKGTDWPLNAVDAAIAQIRTDEYGVYLVRPDILDIGGVSFETVTASLGQNVQKSGRTTGLTLGSVSATDVTVTVGYSKECGGRINLKAQFDNQIMITPETFSLGGDSGSLIVENSNGGSDRLPRTVGLLFAGSSSYTLANPISAVLSSFGVTMVGGTPPPPPVVGSISGAVTAADRVTTIAGATVSADTGQATTTASDGTYMLLNVPIGGRTVTASAAGYSPQSQTATVSESQTTSGVNFALAAAPVATKSIAKCVVYNTYGGKNNDRNLLITIRVVDDLGNPLAGAVVKISLALNGSLYGTGTGTTGASGDITFEARTAPNGTYVTTVSSINATGLTFSGSTPLNSFNKGTDPVPAEFCGGQSSSGTSGGGGGAANAKAAVDQARLVKARHSDELFDIPGVVGHGLGRGDDGQPEIHVFLANDDAQARARIPASIENVRVRVVVTGEFLAR